jgi:hypothetical protein
VRGELTFCPQFSWFSLPCARPLRALAFHRPTRQTEDIYFKSFNATFDQYRAFLEEAGTDPLLLPDRDFDTGQAVKAE